MDQRMTLVTLGVADVARSRAFYEALGWTAAKVETDEVAFFQMGTCALAMYALNKLADDLGARRLQTQGTAVTLAWNARSEAEVDAFFTKALSVGAAKVKAPAKAAWGGYVGYFGDPDGHVWEVAFNPHWPLDENGRLVLPT
jgi:predicted lactoylglutathione lyase